MKYQLTTFIEYISIFLAVASLGACSTVEGIGKDIQSLGSAVQGSAKKDGTTDGAQKAPPSNAVVTPIK